MDSFIIKWWMSACSVLRWVSPFQLVRAAFPRAATTYGFVDGWVVAHLLAAVFAWLFMPSNTTGLLVWLVLGYGSLRVLELVSYNLSVLFVHPLSSNNYALRSFRRSVILALHNYCEVIFWFAAAYRHFAGCFGEEADIVGGVDGALYYSVVTMATVGYGDIAPKDALSRWMVIAHICVSFFLTLVVLARFVSLLPTPQSLDSSEKPEGMKRRD